MKTAMQELIDYMESIGKMSKPLEKAKQLLEKEKQQIMQAYSDGIGNSEHQIDELKYYNETFKQ